VIPRRLPTKTNVVRGNVKRWLSECAKVDVVLLKFAFCRYSFLTVSFFLAFDATFLKLGRRNSRSLYIYIYIYIYVCVCVCVCVTIRTCLRMFSKVMHSLVCCPISGSTDFTSGSVCFVVVVCICRLYLPENYSHLLP
jgi:hypothetical protein